MKAYDILSKVRYSLSDVDKERWSDLRLISLLNDAILDLALTTKLYSSSAFIRMQRNVSTYNVSNFALKLDRVEYLDSPLYFSTYAEMDRSSSWQSVTSEIPTHIIYDLKNAGEFIVYPIPTIGSEDFYTDTSSVYGIITSINYSNDSYNPIMVDSFGEVSPPYIEECLKLFYTSKPTKVTSVTQDLDTVIDDFIVPAIVKYMCGNAFRDSMDTQNRQVGNEELVRYEMDKTSLINNKMINFSKKIRETTYRGMG